MLCRPKESPQTLKRPANLVGPKILVAPPGYLSRCCLFDGLNLRDLQHTFLRFISGQHVLAFRRGTTTVVERIVGLAKEPSVEHYALVGQSTRNQDELVEVTYW